MKKEIRRASYFRANVMLIAVAASIMLMIRRFTKKAK